MSAPRLAKGGSSVDSVVEWDESEALTRVIPQASSFELEPQVQPSRRQVATRIGLPSVPPPPRPRTAAPVAPAPPISPSAKPVAPAPPMSASAKPVAPAPSTSPSVKPRSRVRTVSYALLVVLAAGSGLKLLSGASPAAAGVAAALSSATPTAAVPSEATNRSRPAIEVRSVDQPSVKNAALAFARGDYKESLAQYRALSRGEPAPPAYQSMVRILERRLAPK